MGASVEEAPEEVVSAADASAEEDPEEAENMATVVKANSAFCVETKAICLRTCIEESKGGVRGRRWREGLKGGVGGRNARKLLQSQALAKAALDAKH